MATTKILLRDKWACSCMRQAIPIVEEGLRDLGLIRHDLSGLITQGAYNRSVKASGGTHGGGGVWDVKWYLTKGDNAKEAWFRGGIIPFERITADAPKSQWPNHGHVVTAGCPHLTPVALRQVVSARIGRNALSNGGKFRGWMPDKILDWDEAVALHKAAKNAPKIPRFYSTPPFPWIVADGVLGKQTLDRLRMELNVEPTGIPKWTHFDVAALLVWLGEPYTGSGIITPVAVLKLQHRVGAFQDGIWGPQTTQLLQKWLNRHRERN